MVRDLRDALPESYEAAMHKVHKTLKSSGSVTVSRDTDTVPFYFHTAPFREPTLHAAVKDAVDAKHSVALQLVDMMTAKSARLQRWVGVSYKRDNERRAHYGELALDKCYDMIDFVDKTAALAPIAPKMPPPAMKAAGGGGASKEEVVQSTRSVNKRL